MSTKILEKNNGAVSSCKEFELLMLEEPVYPIEFLNTMKDTTARALQDYLEKTNAPKEVQDLLEDLIVMNTWTDEVEKGRLVKSYVNQFLIETVASAARNIAVIGGTFYSPSGTTYPRELDPISDKGASCVRE